MAMWQWQATAGTAHRHVARNVELPPRRDHLVARSACAGAVVDGTLCSKPLRPCEIAHVKQIPVCVVDRFALAATHSATQRVSRLLTP